MVTTAQLIARAKQAGNLENSEFIDDDEWLGYANASIGELHELISFHYDEDFITEETTLSLTGSLYQLSNPNVKIRLLQKITSDNDKIPLRRVALDDAFSYPCSTNFPGYTQLGDIVKFLPEDQAPGDIYFAYVPTQQVLSGSSDQLSGKYTGGNGWEEFIIIDMAIKALQKEDPSDGLEHLQRRKDAMIERIKNAAANRDLSGQRNPRDTMGRLSHRWFGRWNRTI